MANQKPVMIGAGSVINADQGKAIISHGLMNGISLHYYTVPKTWGDKGSATAFGEANIFSPWRNAFPWMSY